MLGATDYILVVEDTPEMCEMFFESTMSVGITLCIRFEF